MASWTERNMHRVKLYKLNHLGHWDDKGTGHAAVERLPNPEGPGLIVVRESDCKPLLIHKIISSETYQRQGENTIITWIDPDVGTDVALSFQEEAGCAAIWDQLRGTAAEPEAGPGAPPSTGPPAPNGSSDHAPSPAAATAAAPGSPPASGTSPGAPISIGAVDPDLPAGGQKAGLPAAPGGGAAGGGNGLAVSAPGAAGIKLPWPEVGTLKEIAKALSEVPPVQRERVARSLMGEGKYLPRLLELFQASETNQDDESLGQLHGVIKNLVLMNDVQLLEELMSEKHYRDVLGCLEYDPDAAPRRAQHRHFLKNVANFKEVVAIPNPTLREQIHMTFRISYLRDAVLPRALDDATFSTLHSMMFFNYMEILQALQAAPAYFGAVFAKLRTLSRDSEECAELMTFIQEVCQLAVHPQFQDRDSLIGLFVQENLLVHVARNLQSRHPRVLSKSMDILLMLAQNDVTVVRSALMQPPHTLFNVLVQQLLGTCERTLPEQAVEVMRHVLDPESLDCQPQQNEFIRCFYEQFMPDVQEAITAMGKALLRTSSEGAAATEPAAPEPPAAEAAEPCESQRDGSAADGSDPGVVPNGTVPDCGPAHTPSDASDAGCQSSAARPHGAQAAVDDANAPSPYVMTQILEILQYCVQHHGIAMKFYVLKNNLLTDVLHLMRSPKRWLAAAALRFLRACLAEGDEFYNRYIVSHDAFAAPVAAFLANAPRDNLLSSAFLEMLEFIRASGGRRIVMGFVDRHWQALSIIWETPTMQHLRHKYEQFQDPGYVDEGPAAELDRRPRQRCVRELAPEEELYFAEGASDEDESGGGGGADASGAGAARGAGGGAAVPNLAVKFGLRHFGREATSSGWPSAQPASAFADPRPGWLAGLSEDDDDGTSAPPPQPQAASSPPPPHLFSNEGSGAAVRREAGGAAATAPAHWFSPRSGGASQPDAGRSMLPVQFKLQLKRRRSNDGGGGGSGSDDGSPCQVEGQPHPSSPARTTTATSPRAAADASADTAGAGETAAAAEGLGGANQASGAQVDNGAAAPGASAEEAGGWSKGCSAAAGDATEAGGAEATAEEAAWGPAGAAGSRWRKRGIEAPGSIVVKAPRIATPASDGS